MKDLLRIIRTNLEFYEGNKVVLSGDTARGIIAALVATSTPPAPSRDDLREQIAKAVFDPGAYASHRGDRYMAHWTADAVLSVISPAPSRDLVEAMREIERWLTYAAPCRSHDERMKMLGIVRAALATTQAPAEPSGGAAADLARVEEELAEATRLLQRAREERKRLDRRIHNQRCALRVNWEIVEARAKWSIPKAAVRSTYLRVASRAHAENANLRATIAPLQSQLAETQAERCTAEANANRCANIAVAWYDRAEALERALEACAAPFDRGNGMDTLIPFEVLCTEFGRRQAIARAAISATKPMAPTTIQREGLAALERCRAGNQTEAARG